MLIGNGLHVRRVAAAPRRSARSRRATSSARSTVSRKLLQWILDVEAEQVVAEQPVQDVLAPRADAEHFAVRPRNVPELAHHGIRPRFLHEPRQQREVVVLHEDDRARIADLVDHRIGEAAIDALRTAASRLVELRTRVGDVAERPQRVVGAAVVVALSSSSGVSHTRRSVYDGWSGGTATRPRSSTMSRSALPLPCAIHVPPHARITGSSAVTRPLAGRIHDGWSVRPAGRTSSAGSPRRLLLLDVDVRLAVGNHDELGIAQRRAKHGLQFRGIHRWAGLISGR